MKSQQDWRGWHNEGQPRGKDVLSIPFQCRLKLYAFWISDSDAVDGFSTGT
jgi:hypothetical protein